MMLKKRFRHLRARAVSGAEEEDAWPSSISAPVPDPRAGHVEAQAGLETAKAALAQKGLFTAFFIFTPVSPSEGRHEEKKE